MKLEFHEQTEVDMIIPPSPPVLCTFDEGWQGQILKQCVSSVTDARA